MNEFFSALKTDLLDRRLIPFVALAVVALIGAVAYVVVGGAGSSPSAPGAPLPGVVANAGVLGGLPISQSNPEKAVAETTDGTQTQRQGIVHDPFTKLGPSPQERAAAAVAAAAAKRAAGTGSSKSSGSSAGAGGGETGAPKGGSTTPAPAQPAKPSPPVMRSVYHVAVLFGIAPATSTPPGTPLTPFTNLKLQAPLPSAKQPLVVYRGVTAGGKSATFTLVGEAILHGTGSCLPSASQCQAVDLKPKQVEQLEVIESGLAVTYELEVVSITSAKAVAGSLKSLMARNESKVGRELLRHAGLLSIPYLSYSSQPGVLVFAAHNASAARAHTAALGHRGR